MKWLLLTLLLAGCSAPKAERLEREREADARELEMVWTNWLATNKQFHQKL